MSRWTRIWEFFAVDAPEVRKDREQRLARLAELKTIVTRHVADYPTVGAALAEIQARELYRLEHETFEQFLQAEWSMTRQHAHRLIQAAELARTLSPAGYIPKTERLARPLTTLPAEQQLDAWHDAIDAAGTDPVRPEHVAAAVAKRKPTKQRRLKPIRIKVPGASIVIEPSRAFTTAEQALEHALEKLRTTRRAA